MIQALLKIGLSILLLVVGSFIEDSLKPEFVGGAIILLMTTVLLDGGVFVVQNKRRLYLTMRSLWLALTGKYVRVSMSYQYRIKVRDKYLLVQNSNPNWDWYQHVGGKYKRLEETQYILKELGATDDLKMKTDGLKKGDLAVFIPARNLMKFLNWFDTNKDREISHWREFYEELLGGKNSLEVLSKVNFPFINYRFVGSIQTPLKKAPISSGWNCWEILHYDVLDLIPNSTQQMELEELLANGDTDYIKWASASLINRLGYNDDEKQTDYQIGPHAKWVLNLKWSKI